IYKSRAGASGYKTVPTMPTASKWRVGVADSTLPSPDGTLSFGEIHRGLMEKHGPASVLVNDEYDIVHSSQAAGRYLRFVAGQPTRNLLKVIHPALGPEGLRC